MDKQLTVEAIQKQIEERSGLISVMDEAALPDTDPPTTMDLFGTFSRLRLELRPDDGDTFLSRVWQKISMWLLHLLYPRGIVYHPGQLEV